MRVFFVNNLGFTNTLVEEFEKKECEVVSYRNDVDIKIIDNIIKKFKPDLIVISSGPENVKDAGISMEVIRQYAGKIPIFGVGLGHECIIEAFEGKVSRAAVINHGKTTEIRHDEKTIFKKMPNPFYAAAYNSLSASDVPYSFEVSARSKDNIVMAVRHKEFFVESVQFNPESILTLHGSLIIENLLKEIGKK